MGGDGGLSYQHDGVFLVEQVIPEPLATPRDDSACDLRVDAAEAIGHVKTECPLEPSDGRAAEGGKLAEEGDEDDERDGKDAEEDVADGAHLRRGSIIGDLCEGGSVK